MNTTTHPPKHSRRLTEKVRRLRSLIERGASPRRLENREQPDSALAELVGPIGPRRLVDCLAAGRGSGAGLAALSFCRQAAAARGEFVVVDPQGVFFPPAAVAWGVNARRLLVVRPATEKDAHAAVELALRSPAVSAVWAKLSRIDDRAFRRLLLATEAGEAFGALVRSAEHQHDPSWANVQLRFDPAAEDRGANAPMTIDVTRTRNRHGLAGGTARLQADWLTGQVKEVDAGVQTH